MNKRRLSFSTFHCITPEKVHFYEVGATGAIIDIVGTGLGLDWRGAEVVGIAPSSGLQ
jgi:uncharacterized protein (DUF111 family)